MAYLPAYFSLIDAVNPVAVSIGEIISDRVLSFWRGVEPSKQLLQIEHLEAVDETYFKANPILSCTILNKAEIQPCIYLIGQSEPQSKIELGAVSIYDIEAASICFKIYREVLSKPRKQVYTGKHYPKPIPV